MTYTILASDSAQQLLGVATASRSLAVGAGVPAVRVGVGAVASQAYTNRALRGVLLEGLADGAAPEEVIGRLDQIDAGLARRQVGAVTAHGDVAVHTGNECTPWAGSRGGAHFVVLGNFLVGPQVLDSMAQVFEAEPEPEGAAAFAECLHRVLLAGEHAGGDLRGRQSAAIMVGSSAGESDASDNLESDLAIDLRIDDHGDPLRELGRLLKLVSSA